MSNTQTTVVNRFSNTDVKVHREGTMIILPNDPCAMSYDEGILALQRVKADEETEVSINETIKAMPFDGAYAFMKAMARLFGWATPQPTQGFFGPKPPTTISVEIGYNKTTQIIWGAFAVPGIDGVLKSGYTFERGMPCFQINGTVKKRHMKDIKRLADLTREIAQNESIYKGQAIRVETGTDGKINWQTPPKFIDLSRVNPDELTFSADVLAQINTNVFTPIEHTGVCRKYGIPLKRGVLLEGPYGTGKTLTAFVAAQKCIANDWTFVLLDKVASLEDGLTFARMYQPAVVFAEDIDRAVQGERSVQMDDILNTIDGIESKGSEIITILTSNHVENINKAMLRPGRLDAIINVHAPDALAAEKLVRIYARNTLDPQADLTAAGLALAGKIPASIREVVERAKLYSISRNPESETVAINADDLVHAATGMQAHFDLMVTHKPERTEQEVFYDSYMAMVKNSLGANQEGSFLGKLDEIHENLLN